jgi:hypothetical protein
MALAADHNAGTVPLTFGITSNDEMCFTIGAFYLDDDTAPMPPVPDCYAGGTSRSPVPGPEPQSRSGNSRT